MTAGRTSLAWAVALEGLGGHLVEVETHVAAGLPRFVLIGLPDASLGEARDRIRAALNSAGLPLPLQRVTTNMSPASLRKHGSGFDLAIAVSILAATGAIEPEGPMRAAHVGELALTGAVRPVRGVLPIVAAARDAGLERVVVPAECAAEASHVDGIEVVPVASLQELAHHYGADAGALAPEPDADGARLLAIGDETGRNAEAAPNGARRDALDLADVVGNDHAVRALLVAAAGGHHLAMVGPPGSGKTMLAERLPGLLPPLEVDAAIEIAALRSLRGEPVGAQLDRRAPFEAPHHTASSVALVGGGSGAILPGAISLAAHGVLFLDEAPEFPRRVLDALRQPLEAGRITLHRASQSATFPANAQLVLASNPCPCGNAGSADLECRCSPQAQRTYLSRLSGPLLDRIDLQLRVDRLSPAAARLAADGAVRGLATRDAAVRVAEARARAAERYRDVAWSTNAAASGHWLRESARSFGRAVTEPLDRALERGRISMRGHTRTLRVAWTLADLDGTDHPTRDHLGEALWFRVREEHR